MEIPCGYKQSVIHWAPRQTHGTKCESQSNELELVLKRSTVEALVVSRISPKEKAVESFNKLETLDELSHLFVPPTVHGSPNTAHRGRRLLITTLPGTNILASGETHRTANHVSYL